MKISRKLGVLRANSRASGVLDLWKAITRLPILVTERHIFSTPGRPR